MRVYPTLSTMYASLTRSQSAAELGITSTYVQQPFTSHAVLASNRPLLSILEGELITLVHDTNIWKG